MPKDNRWHVQHMLIVSITLLPVYNTCPLCSSHRYWIPFQVSEQTFNQLKDEVKELVEKMKKVKDIVPGIWDFLSNQQAPLPYTALPLQQSVCESPSPLLPPLQLMQLVPLSQPSVFTELRLTRYESLSLPHCSSSCSPSGLQFPVS